MVSLHLIGVSNLFSAPAQGALCANHVSRKAPLNHCSNRELRLTRLVFVVQSGPMRRGLGPVRRLLFSGASA
jgi:hypothetical protein